ncbi:MAG: hypothetical protein AAFR76_14460 [Planctomycetota bacterium]
MMVRPIMALVLAVAACWPAVVAAQPGDLPLLESPKGLGLIYSERDPAAAPLTDRAWQMAIKRGVNSYQLTVPWDQIALPDGTPDMTYVEPLLDLLQQSGLQVYFTLQSVDTTALRLPAVLMDPTNPRRLRPDLSFDSPEVIGHLTALLDELVPLLAQRGGFALSLANEVDIYLSINPDQTLPLAVFAEFGRVHGKSLEPDMRFGVTLTHKAMANPDLTLLMMSVSDAAIFTYYPLDGNVENPAVIDFDFDSMEAFAGGRPIILQEAGVPGAPADGSPSVIGASDELQRQWVEAVYREVRERESIRFVSWLHLADWPADVIDFFQQYYGLSEPDFVEFLSGLGLMTDQGVARPALRELMIQLRRTSRPAVQSTTRATP